jgi:hypothetical protein
MSIHGGFATKKLRKRNGTKYIHSKKDREHTIIAESVLGKKLPYKSEIHHIDENKRNNQKSNLVICQDRGYHLLLHVRKAALIGCGDVNKRYCSVCEKWLDQNCFYLRYDRKEPRIVHPCKSCQLNNLKLERNHKRAIPNDMVFR